MGVYPPSYLFTTAYQFSFNKRITSPLLILIFAYQLLTTLLTILAVFDGAEEQNRTVDTRIFSPLLYLLSYLGVKVILSKTSLVVKPSSCLGPSRQVQQQQARRQCHYNQGDLG
jgi:hypothetical protein